MMNIHRIYYPVLTLGPGARIGIWTRGCQKQCPGCLSPELSRREAKYEIPLPVLEETLTGIFSARPVDGVTISGGEPADQYEELTVLLSYLTRYTEDILVYSGYTKEELGEEKFCELRRSANLVLGPYIAAKNDGGALRGSSNQEIVYRSAAMKKKYQAVVCGPRSVQPVIGTHELFFIGITG